MKNMIHPSDIQPLLEAFYTAIKTHSRKSKNHKRAIMESLSALAVTAAGVIAAFEVELKPEVAHQVKEFFLSTFHAELGETVKIQRQARTNS